MVLQVLSQKKSVFFECKSSVFRVSKVRLALVRYGDVLGSFSLVIRLFNSQIKYGGPLVVALS